MDNLSCRFRREGVLSPCATVQANLRQMENDWWLKKAGEFRRRA